MYILFILYIYIYMYIKYMMTSDNDLLGPGALLNGGIQLVVPSFTNLLARPIREEGGHEDPALVAVPLHKFAHLYV